MGEAETKRLKDKKAERVEKQKALEAEAEPGQDLAEVMAQKQHDVMDILAKDAYVASLGDSQGHSRSSKQEKNVALKLEEDAQSANSWVPQLKPGALAATGEAPQDEEHLFERRLYIHAMALRHQPYARGMRKLGQ